MTPIAPSTAQVLSLIADEMAQVDAVIGQRLSSDVPLVGQVAQHIIASGGKRLRPALLLLMHKAMGHDSPHRHNLAAVVEFIHTATLLHDDVVDESSLRRGRTTANHVFGNAASVLVGDFLYSRAFQMMVEVGRMRVMELLAAATNVIAEGEVMQLMNMHDPDLDEVGYLKVIRFKTAKLFEASAQLAAVLADAPAELEAQCATYGQALGTAFQVIDDVLDYEGQADELGKSLGDDLREGKVTLPIIWAQRLGSPQEQAMIRAAIEQGSLEQLDEIVAVIRRCGALDKAREAAANEAARAIAAAQALPSNAYSQALVHLAADLLGRRN